MQTEISTLTVDVQAERRQFLPLTSMQLKIAKICKQNTATSLNTNTYKDLMPLDPQVREAGTAPYRERAAFLLLRHVQVQFSKILIPTVILINFTPHQHFPLLTSK